MPAPDRQFAACLAYIEKSLKDCVITRQDDAGTLLGLPHPYVVPNTDLFNEMYYWDSYFTLLGLVELGWLELARGMTENCLYLIEKYGFVPNANRAYYLTRSQPPLLTSMINEIYSREKDDAWLRRALATAEKEYNHYWNAVPHLVPEIGLSRFFDSSGENQPTEEESGWDLTPRFLKRANDFCPVCLNGYLYKYESDFASYYLALGDAETAGVWQRLAEKRRDLINEYMWDEKAGLFFDYDVKNARPSHVRTLAAYTPLWCHLATPDQAERLVANLHLFEHPGGLATCDQDYGMPERQWNFPNGWPPLQWLTVTGLQNYGYDAKARDIRDRWLNLCARVFEETGYLWEKYDVVNLTKGSDDERYKTQKGFSWTNAIFLALYRQER